MWSNSWTPESKNPRLMTKRVYQTSLVSISQTRRCGHPRVRELSGGIDGSGISQGESVRLISPDPELSGSVDTVPWGRVPWGSDRLLRCGSGFTNIPAFRSSLSLLRSSFFNPRGSVENEGGIQFHEWYPSSWVLPIDPSDVIIKRWVLSQTVGHLHLSRLAGEGGAG